MKYFIIEDNFDDVVLLEIKLGRLNNFNVHKAYPSEAVEWNRKHLPDIVQLDGLVGKCFELYSELRQDNPDAHYILYSGNRGLRDEATRMGLPAFDKGDGPDAILDYVKQLSKSNI